MGMNDWNSGLRRICVATWQKHFSLIKCSVMHLNCWDNSHTARSPSLSTLSNLGMFLLLSGSFSFSFSLALFFSLALSLPLQGSTSSFLFLTLFLYWDLPRCISFSYSMYTPMLIFPSQHKSFSLTLSFSTNILQSFSNSLSFLTKFIVYLSYLLSLFNSTSMFLCLTKLV